MTSAVNVAMPQRRGTEDETKTTRISLTIGAGDVRSGALSAFLLSGAETTGDMVASHAGSVRGSPAARGRARPRPVRDPRPRAVLLGRARPAGRSPRPHRASGPAG